MTGLENEGIVDPWQLLSAVREKNITLGVQYIKARIRNFVLCNEDDIDASEFYSPRDAWRLSEIDCAMVW